MKVDVCITVQPFKWQNSLLNIYKSDDNIFGWTTIVIFSPGPLSHHLEREKKREKQKRKENEEKD
jgi:hypothetical protein